MKVWIGTWKDLQKRRYGILDLNDVVIVDGKVISSKSWLKKNWPIGSISKMNLDYQSMAQNLTEYFTGLLVVCDERK